MCEIEHDKTVGKSPNKGGRPQKYPFPALGVGDSFVVPLKSTADISGSVNYANKKFYPANFKAFTHDAEGNRVFKDGLPGVRVMRIA